MASPYEREVEPRTLLAYFLREDCGLTGTHVGCDTSSCGCCVVVIDGDRAVKSCTMFAAQADGHEIMTVEGLARRWHAAPVAAGVLGSPWTAVRLLHTRDAADGVCSSEAPTQPDRGGHPRRTRRATCAAAPATRTSSRRCSRRRRTCGSRQPRPADEDES